MTETALNGIDLAPVGQFIEAAKADHDVAHITFKATSRWGGAARAPTSR